MFCRDSDENVTGATGGSDLPRLPVVMLPQSSSAENLANDTTSVTSDMTSVRVPNALVVSVNVAVAVIYHLCANHSRRAAVVFSRVCRSVCPNKSTVKLLVRR